MNEDKRELLYRSLDTPLTEAEQKKLKRALADSTELQAELAALLRMRETLSDSTPTGFGPFFPERVMARLRAEEASPEALWQSVRSLFRWVAAAAVPVAAALVIWNIQPSTSPTPSSNGGAYQADVIWGNTTRVGDEGYVMKTRTSAALLLIATLVIGVVLGALGGRAYMMKQRPWPGPPGMHGERPGPGQFADRFAERLENLLEIDDAQRDTVRAILDVHMDQMMVLNEQHRAEASVLMDTLLLEMRGVLTDEQLATFEEHLKNRQLRGPGRRFGKGRKP